MKWSFFIASLMLSSIIVKAQSPSYLNTLNSFKEYYNQADYEALYTMLNENMLKRVSNKQLSSILGDFQTYFGKITHYEFVEENGIIEKYVAHFEEGERYVSLALDSEEKISGLLFKPIDDGLPGKFDRNSTSLQLPFKGEWFTFWGGDHKRQNYHVINKAQQGAFDFIIVDKNNRSYERSGTRNEDYYAFGKPIYAVCDAMVYKATTGITDNKPGSMNPSQPSGNNIMLKTPSGEFIQYSHFMQASIKVKQGDLVKKGQYLGDCGNSGNSSEPHLHLHIQDGPNPFTAKGARCFFEEIKVNGVLEKDYSPVKGDKISLPKL